MKEHRACPFCGTFPEFEVKDGISILKKDCKCGAAENFLIDGNSFDWNRRPIEDALRARINELKEALKIASGYI